MAVNDRGCQHVHSGYLAVLPTGLQGFLFPAAANAWLVCGDTEPQNTTRDAGKLDERDGATILRLVCGGFSQAKEFLDSRCLGQGDSWRGTKQILFPSSSSVLRLEVSPEGGPSPVDG